GLAVKSPVHSVHRVHLVLVAAWLALSSLAHAAEKMNVLLIMADDLRDFGGAFTHQVVKTPNLDRLRAHGVSFERSYVQYTVCNPSRTSMMTSLRAEQTRVVDNNTQFRKNLPDIVTMPQLCKEAGWQAYGFGKLFHLGGKGQDRTVWMDLPKSWTKAEAAEAT